MVVKGLKNTNRLFGSLFVLNKNNAVLVCCLTDIFHTEICVLRYHKIKMSFEFGMSFNEEV